MVTMHDGHLSRIIKLSQDKRMTPDRWTTVLASPVFAALLDEHADLSDPQAVLIALKLPVKKRPVSRKVLADFLELTGEPVKVASCKCFVASQKWVVDRNGELPISSLSENIRTHFLGLIEENVPAATLKQRKLLKNSGDTSIISAYGGQAKVKIPFAHVFEYLKTADRTEWYVFYVIGTDGYLWAVYAFWDNRGWDVDARVATGAYAWFAGRHVVSR